MPRRSGLSPAFIAILVAVSLLFTNAHAATAPEHDLADVSVVLPRENAINTTLHAYSMELPPSPMQPQRNLASENRRQTKRVYSLVDHLTRIGVYAFLSAVFAGLTLGVMCADTFTLEIIAESGPYPDCTYAATLLPLRKKGHKTLCTLIISNMLCNVLIVQEFSVIFDIIEALQSHGAPTEVGGYTDLWKFVVSTTLIVVVAELIPMSICKSKYSLRVAAAGSIFVRVAMVLTYPVAAPIGMLLDWIIGCEETGQIYDRRELRKMMVLQYEHDEERDGTMAKTELELLLAAMDFQEATVRDIMTPIDQVSCVKANDIITADFVQRVWLSGRSRFPVESSPGHYDDILVARDLMTVHVGQGFEPMTVAQVVKPKKRLFAMVSEDTTLPMMLKCFQDAKTHMAVVFSEDGPAGEAGLGATYGGESHVDSTLRRSIQNKSFAGTTVHRPTNVVGVVTMEDVVEQLLNEEIYDEYDRYDPVEPGVFTSPSRPKAPVLSGNIALPFSVRAPSEPKKPPRVNFFSYLTHPETPSPLSDAQVWAVVYYLNRAVTSFISWSPGCIKMLLDECGDQQFLPTTSFINVGDTAAAESSHTTDTMMESSSMFAPPSSMMNVLASMAANPFPEDEHATFVTGVEERRVMYRSGIRTEFFTLVLGGRVDVLVGDHGFHTNLLPFQWLGEEALRASYYLPDYSAVVSDAARIYRIPRDKFEKYLSYQAAGLERASHLHILPASPKGLRPLRARTDSSASLAGTTSQRRSHSTQLSATKEMSRGSYGTFGRRKEEV